MRTHRLWPAALLLLLAPVLAACGDDDDGAAGKDASTDAPTSASSEPSAVKSDVTVSTGPPSATSTDKPPVTVSSAPPGATDAPPACELATARTVADAYNLTLGAGQPGVNFSKEDGSSWRGTTCMFTVPKKVEITVKVADAEDFTLGGGFACPQPSEESAIIEPVDDITGASKAWWRTSDAPPLRALMRACTDDVLLDIQIDYADGVNYDGDPRTESVELASLLIGNL